MLARRKALSDPLHTHVYRRHVQLTKLIEEVGQRNKETSPLLRLPAELRNKIYNYVFYMPCVSPKYETQDRRTWEYPRSWLSLLQACRQTYNEAWMFPFTLNLFSGYAEHAIEMLCTTLTPMQADGISRVSLLVDAFAIYRDGKIPDAGLKAWFVAELSDLCMLAGLKHLELIWFGSDVEVVRIKLREQVAEVLERARRTDIVLTVVD